MVDGGQVSVEEEKTVKMDEVAGWLIRWELGGDLEREKRGFCDEEGAEKWRLRKRVRDL